MTWTEFRDSYLSESVRRISKLKVGDPIYIDSGEQPKGPLDGLVQIAHMSRDWRRAESRTGEEIYVKNLRIVLVDRGTSIEALSSSEAVLSEPPEPKQFLLIRAKGRSIGNKNRDFLYVVNGTNPNFGKWMTVSADPVPRHRTASEWESWYKAQFSLYTRTYSTLTPYEWVISAYGL